MCGRFSLHGPRERLLDHFQLDDLPAIEARYNIAPSQDILIVRAREDRTMRRADLVRWGLLPSWAKEPDTRYSMINARAETVADKPAFRAAFRSRRCLIPADGFYEWKSLGGKTKQPYHIRMRDGSVFAFAGLWERWKSEDRVIESTTIIVTEPNATVRPVHDRMPVILRADDYDRWLAPETGDRDKLLALLQPYPAEAMEAFPVSRLVNNPRNEDARVLEPAGGDSA